MSKQKLSKQPIYKNPNQPVEKRVNDLIKRMTLEEKVMQLSALIDKDILDNMEFSLEKARKSLKHGIGELSMLLRGFYPKDGVKIANEIQKFLVENTRLGIPAIIHDECLHGCMARNSTSFPQSIALACSWDPELVEQVASVIGKETRARGIQHALTPTINIARDVRCGRTEETYGEDPYLTSRMGVAWVKGFQSQGLVATIKHFAANFSADGGRDSNEIHFSERILREIYFPAFKECICNANALSVMAAYNSIDGIPCSCNKWLLTDILRKEWGFKGFVVSDYMSINGVYERHKVAETPSEAAKKCISAGLDVELPFFDYYKHLIKLVKDKKLSIKIIDESVKRVLRVKFLLGLFENPYTDENHAEKIVNCAEHRQLALEVARKCIVLLKNTEGILPLSKNLKRIAVIGPNANSLQLGGYSAIVDKVVSPLEGIKNKLKNTEILYAQGCGLKDKSRDGFASALNIAKQSEVAILVMGNSSGWSDEYNTEGEDRDRCNLDLPGVQEDLINEVSATGIPVIVVLINGSAVTMTNWIDNVKSVVEAWYPGEEGGNAIADILFGDYNPSGKLVITFPKFSGQLPLYYNYKPSGRRTDYVDLRGEQTLFPFGYGLSYTQFEYSNLKIKPSKIKKTGKVEISVDVTNTGKFDGDEVVMLFIRDIVSSIARPIKELKGFKRITLKSGEKKTVKFLLGFDELSFLDEKLRPVVEPGIFKVMISDLTGEFEVI